LFVMVILQAIIQKLMPSGELIVLDGSCGGGNGVSSRSCSRCSISGRGGCRHGVSDSRSCSCGDGILLGGLLTVGLVGSPGGHRHGVDGRRRKLSARSTAQTLKVSEVLDGLEVLKRILLLVVSSSLLTILSGVVIIMRIFPRFPRILLEMVDHREETKDVLISDCVVSSGGILTADHARVFVGSSNIGAFDSSCLVVSSSSSLNDNENRSIEITHVSFHKRGSSISSPSTTMMTMSIGLSLLHVTVGRRLVGGRSRSVGNGCTAEKNQS
ncbi:hypothetical protein PFISCL1PPCAC_24703, partial [Pristionchus fissidentatus]